MEMRIRSLILAIVMVPSLNAIAKSAHGPVTATEIRAAASHFLQEYASDQKKQQHHVSFSVGQIDPRLRMAPCNAPIEVTFITKPMDATHVTLQASCQGTRPWRLFLGARIQIKANAYVTRVPLARGMRITPSMITTRQVAINQSHGSIFSTSDGLVGMQLIRPVNAGTVLTSKLLRAPDLVARGDRVIIEAQVASIAVKTRGTALSDGRKGQQILVRNDRSKRTVKAVVTGPGQVNVPM